MSHNQPVQQQSTLVAVARAASEGSARSTQEVAEMHVTSDPSVLPPLYARWASEFLGGSIPAESEATCSDCAMLCSSLGKTDAPAVAPFFDPCTKCCTYLPALPNFLVGRMLADDGPEFARGRATVEARLDQGIAVTPCGIGRSAAYDRLYATEGKLFFGRDRSMRCPHYLDEGGGQCGIWRHRAAVCATWFCKYARGAVGQRFWQSLHRLLSTVERELSVWCALQLGVEAEVARGLVVGRTQALARGPNDFDRFGVADWQGAFGNWSGRERRFFEECARLVDPLGWPDVERICGPEVRSLTKATRDAFDKLRSRAIPLRLRVGSLKVIEPQQRSSIVEGYDGGDRLALPNELLDALHFFDSSATTALALRTIRAETGLAIERDLVRLLVDFEILVPATPRE